MSDGPIGWVETTLGEVCSLKYGKALPAGLRDGSGAPVFGSNGCVGYHSTPLTHGPTIIVGRKGSVGEIHFSERPCSPIDTTYFIDAFESMEPRLLAWLLKSLPLAELNRSTAIPGLNREDAYKLPVSVPPRAEQQRIVAKLNILLGRVDACRERLERVGPLIKRFRQAVIHAATSGELTRGLVNGRAQSSWRRLSLGEVTVDVRYGTSKRCEYRDAGLGVLRIPNIGATGLIELADMKRADFDESEVESLALRAGDLLVIRSNGSLDLVGRTAVVGEEAAGLLYAGYLIRLRLDTTLIDPQFAYLHLASPLTRRRIAKTAKSTSGVNNINASELRALPIGLPSMLEQREAVRRAQRLLTWAGSLEQRLTELRRAMIGLTPATLAKAFRGELVPQDPADEPASALLARLRASAPASAPAAAGGKPRGRPRRAA